jgi:hypothetical protein
MPTASSDTVPCSDERAVVVCEDTGQAAAVCPAVKIAVCFWAESGLSISLPLQVKIVDSLASVHGVGKYGQYRAQPDLIEILSYEATGRMLGNKSMFGVSFNEEIYSSFVIHEVTHAIVHLNFLSFTPSFVAHEYIAYVAQLATMSGGTRRKILKWAPVEGFTDEHEISWTYLGLNPEYFAIKSYLHYMRPENGQAFIQRLLSGDFEIEPELEF